MSAGVCGCSIVANDEGDIAAGKRSAVAAQLAARAVGAGVGASRGSAAKGGGAVWNWSAASSASPIAAFSETESSKTVLVEEVQSGLVGVKVRVLVRVQVVLVRVWVSVSV